MAEKLATKTRLGPSTRRQLGALELADGDAGDRRQVAGDERQHAGREEGDEPGSEGRQDAHSRCRIALHVGNASQPGLSVSYGRSAEPNVLVTQPSASSSQSPTHSQTLPTMSLAPKCETQPALAPVFWTAPVLTLQASESGVPATAACHSALVGSRLPEFASAC